MNYISPEGLEKLNQELESRKNIRPEIARRIQDSKALGDLAENSEYQEALEAHSFNEGRIEELEELVKNAIIIDEEKRVRGNIIDIGTKIKTRSKFGEKEFVIVGSSEADPVRGLISNESPLGMAFLSKKKGDIVMVETPGGSVEYAIMDVD